MRDPVTGRIYLSPPHMGTLERGLLDDAFDSNWIAPLGPHVDAFESEFAARVGAKHALAVSSGTAALQLALIAAGVHTGDQVIVSDLTFVASVNPVLYVGATPVFVGSERVSWNMDPSQLEDALRQRARQGRQPTAIVLVHLYGQSADVDAISSIAERYGVQLIEDAAEALGASYKSGHPGTMGRAGIFSFNGNKIITTSGGGMLVSDDEALIRHARKLSTQAREPAPHYQHSEVGYNFRMSNLLAAVGRGQLRVLEDRVQARRRVFDRYRAGLGDVPGIAFQPEAPWGRHTRWLTCVTIDPSAFGADREELRRSLEKENIEARPLWKPMHLQPLFAGCEVFGGDVGAAVFRDGLCLPSGSSLDEADQARVIAVARRVAESSVRANAAGRVVA